MKNELLTFYHAPHSRSGGVRILLEELGCPYQMRILNLKKQEQRKPEYLAINPMGKVPAIVHGKTLVTEQPAIFIYLADAFSQKNLAPAIDEPLRGTYLRWMVFYGSCFEPALLDKAFKHDKSDNRSSSVYGDYDTMFKTLIDQLERGPYLLGDRFSAADILWGEALTWTTNFKMVPELPVITEYIKRHAQRESVTKAREADAKLAASQES
jgi:glutathione S-transferase